MPKLPFVQKHLRYDAGKSSHYTRNALRGSPRPAAIAYTTGMWPAAARQNTPRQELFLYARSFHKAAKALAASLQTGTSPFTDPDVSPVVFMYRTPSNYT
jgi:hypothetical protein